MFTLGAKSIERVETEFFYGAPMNKSKSWELFYKLAWLEDMLDAIGSMTQQVESPGALSFVHKADFFCSARTMFEHFPEDIGPFLKIVGNHPDFLRHPDILNLYISLSKYAKDGDHAQSRRKLRKLFHEHYIPDTKKDEKNRRSERKEIARELMTKLAKRLQADVCKALRICVPAKKKTGPCRSVENQKRKKLAEMTSDSRLAALSKDDKLTHLIDRLPGLINDLITMGFDLKDHRSLADNRSHVRLGKNS
jgi:hypothetical protein